MAYGTADGAADGASPFRQRIDRLRGSAAAGDALPDTVTALTDCIRTPDRGAARTLAVAWLQAAELAAAAGSAGSAATGRAPLALLAGALGVPAAYFTDPETARVVDADRELSAGAAGRGAATRGPCRTGVPPREIGTVRDRLLRELERAPRAD